MITVNDQKLQLSFTTIDMKKFNEQFLVQTVTPNLINTKDYDNVHSCLIFHHYKVGDFKFSYDPMKHEIKIRRNEGTRHLWIETIYSKLDKFIMEELILSNKEDFLLECTVDLIPLLDQTSTLSIFSRLIDLRKKQHNFVANVYFKAYIYVLINFRSVSIRDLVNMSVLQYDDPIEMFALEVG